MTERVSAWCTWHTEREGRDGGGARGAEVRQTGRLGGRAGGGRAELGASQDGLHGWLAGWGKGRRGEAQA